MATVADKPPAVSSTDRQRKRSLQTEKTKARKLAQDISAAVTSETNTPEDDQVADMLEDSDESEQPLADQSQVAQQKPAKRPKKYDPFPNDIGEQPEPDAQSTASDDQDQTSDTQPSTEKSTPSKPSDLRRPRDNSQEQSVDTRKTSGGSQPSGQGSSDQMESIDKAGEPNPNASKKVSASQGDGSFNKTHFDGQYAHLDPGILDTAGAAEMRGKYQAMKEAEPLEKAQHEARMKRFNELQQEISERHRLGPSKDASGTINNSTPEGSRPIGNMQSIDKRQIPGGSGAQSAGQTPGKIDSREIAGGTKPSVGSKKFQTFPEGVGSAATQLGAQAGSKKKSSEESEDGESDAERRRRYRIEKFKESIRAYQRAKQIAQDIKTAAQVARATAAAVESVIAFLAATSEVWVPILVIVLAFVLAFVGIAILAAMACSGQTGTVLDLLPADVKKAIVDLVTGLACPK